MNPKSFYSYVRSKSKTKDQVCPLKTENGNMVVKDEDVCEVLNDYFSSVFTREDINCSVTDFPILRDFFQVIRMMCCMIYLLMRNLF